MEATVLKTMQRIDAMNAPALGEMLENATTEDGANIVVDMEDTVYICSVGLRAFLAIQKKLRKTGGSMVLHNVKPQIMEIFEVTGFAGVLTIE